MAGTPVRVRFTEGQAASGTLARIAQEQNDMVDALEALRVLLTNSSGVPVAVVNFAIQRLDAIGLPAKSSGGTLGPAALVKIAGDNQSANVGAGLPVQLKVQVIDLQGNPVIGATCLWDCDPTIARITAQSATDASGFALCTVVQQFQSAVSYPITCTVPGVAIVTFTETATAGPTATSLEAAGPTDVGSGTVGAAIGTKPSVRVLDQFGNPMAGTTVTFAVASGGGSGTGLTVVSDVNGIATVGSWTLGAVAGLNTMTATASGLTGSPITFSAVGVATIPTQIANTAGSGQTPVAGAAAATPLQFTVKDVSNNPIAGAVVTFDILSEPTGTPGTLSAASGSTNASGQASVSLIACNTKVGATVVRARVTGAAGQVFTATCTVNSVAGAATKWVIAVQPSSNAVNNVAFSTQPQIQLADANGNAVATAGVVCTASKASGPDTLAGTLTATTTAAGLAIFTNLKFQVAAGGGTNTIQFAGTVTAAVSNGVAVVPPVAVAVQFAIQPNGATTGVASIQCRVQVVDANNVIVPGATDLVHLALVPVGATLGGVVDVPCVAGLADFTGLSVSADGTWQLVATSGTLTSATSNAFVTSTPSGAVWPLEPATGSVVGDVDLGVSRPAPGFVIYQATGNRGAVIGGEIDEPVSPPLALEVSWPAGFASGGGGPEHLDFNLSGFPGTELFAGFTIKLGPTNTGNSTGGGGQSGVQKLVFLSYYDANGQVVNALILAAFCFNAAGAGNGFRAEMRTQLPAGGNWNGGGANVNTPFGAMALGVYHKIMCRIRLNTGSNADGSCQLQLNNNPVVTVNNILFTTGPKKFALFRINPTVYAAGYVSPAAQYLRYGHAKLRITP